MAKFSLFPQNANFARSDGPAGEQRLEELVLRGREGKEEGAHHGVLVEVLVEVLLAAEPKRLRRHILKQTVAHCSAKL